MRVHTMLTALALVCLGLQTSAYPIQVQTVPLALQGVWVNLADAKQRHAACKSIKQQSPPRQRLISSPLAAPSFAILIAATYPPYLLMS